MARILLLADTHLGFDEPSRPRVRRRRRGPDFFASYRRALASALAGEVDLVVHGGDLLYRARVPASLVQRAVEPLFEVADAGVPVALVPGNHERARIPYPLLTLHRNLHVFRRPRTFVLDCNGERVALSGFPFARRIERAFPHLLEETGWRDREADVRLLCMHQAVDGARVGVQEFTFRAGPEVLSRHALPREFDAVLSGHIHRRQALCGGAGPPVLYPGSTERTSFQERAEAKGYLLVDVAAGRPPRWSFVSLPTRPMVHLEIDGPDGLRDGLAGCPPDAVVRVRLRNGAVSAARLRSLAPQTMNVSVSPHAARRS